MTSGRFSSLFCVSCVAIFWLIVAPASLGQGPLSDAAMPTRALEPDFPVTISPVPISPVSVSPVSVVPFGGESAHKFWDNQNRILLVAAAALNTADFAVTRTNLQSGGQELNPLVRPFGRSTAGLAVNFAAETAGVISLS